MQASRTADLEIVISQINDATVKNRNAKRNIANATTRMSAAQTPANASTVSIKKTDRFRSRMKNTTKKHLLPERKLKFRSRFKRVSLSSTYTMYPDRVCLFISVYCSSNLFKLVLKLYNLIHFMLRNSQQ